MLSKLALLFISLLALVMIAGVIATPNSVHAQTDLDSFTDRVEDFGIEFQQEQQRENDIFLNESIDPEDKPGLMQDLRQKFVDAWCAVLPNCNSTPASAPAVSQNNSQSPDLITPPAGANSITYAGYNCSSQYALCAMRMATDMRDCEADRSLARCAELTEACGYGKGELCNKIVDPIRNAPTTPANQPTGQPLGASGVYQQSTSRYYDFIACTGSKSDDECAQDFAATYGDDQNLKNGIQAYQGCKARGESDCDAVGGEALSQSSQNDDTSPPQPAQVDQAEIDRALCTLAIQCPR